MGATNVQNCTLSENKYYELWSTNKKVTDAHVIPPKISTARAVYTNAIVGGHGTLLGAKFQLRKLSPQSDLRSETVSLWVLSAI